MIQQYNRDEIQRIIYSGSVEEKAVLFIRDRMGYFPIDGLGFVLQFGEPEYLTNTISYSEQVRWNKYISFALRLENGFKDIIRFTNSLKEQEGYLERDLNSLIELDRFERFTNRILLNTEQDRDYIIKEALRSVSFRKCSPTYSTEGGLDFGLFKKGGFFEDCLEERDILRTIYKALACYREAMRRRIKESDFPDIPEYQTILRETDGECFRSIPTIGRFFDSYLSGMDSETSMRRLKEELTIPKINLSKEEEMIDNFYKRI